MKLRRRDPNQIFLAQGYYSLKHDGSDQGLKKFRTMASLNPVESESSIKRQNTNFTEQKRTKTIQNTESRFKKNFKKHESTKVLEPASHITNANEFSHLASVHYMDPAQIQWAVGLRHHQQSITKRSFSISQIPSTYYKTTESSKNHQQPASIPSNLNYNTFKHLTEKGQHPSMGVLRFQTSLRETDAEARRKSPQMIEKEKSFKTIPIRDRNQYPKLLNSESLKKKTINPEEDMETAFDGNHKYPSYTDKIIKEKNYNNLREHLKNIPRGKINLPSLGWQTGLRSYQVQSRRQLTQRNSDINGTKNI